ncbi:uncharacterized protein B0H64DRAFT_205258 [Chaetomium fimeti]|uniref:Ankyrin repeat protein n=1 Tax=Chaetomium fimeti TaxID=1854472 RepID=A0AAE0LQD7_9PEZI|nr:hypothetical protein B0H64DRAFT_205258 [Chaetomium fimeti]
MRGPRRAGGLFTTRAVSNSDTVVKALLRAHANANAAADDGITPLIAALRAVPHTQAVLDELLSSDNTSLYEQVQNGKDDIVRRLLDVGYNVNKEHQWGGTALHAVVKREGPKGWEPVEMAKALLAADPKPDLTIKDNDGLTPVRLALRESCLSLVDLFLKSSVGLTKNISADDWLQLCGNHNARAIRVLESARHGTRIDDFSESEFLYLRTLSTPPLPYLRQLIIFTTKSLTTPPTTLVDRILNRPLATLYPFRPMIPVFDHPAQGGSGDYICAVYFLSLSQLLNPTVPDPGSGKLLMIRWTVVESPNSGEGLRTGGSRTGQSWKSVTHFSTLRNGGMPDDGVDFFKQFLEDLKAEWLRICADADDHLSNERKTMLRQGGRDPDLIQRLLVDAGVWIELQDYLKLQVEKLYHFESEYGRLGGTEEKAKKLWDIIQEFNDVISMRLEKLNPKSQELIQTVCPGTVHADYSFVKSSHKPPVPRNST